MPGFNRRHLFVKSVPQDSPHPAAHHPPPSPPLRSPFRLILRLSPREHDETRRTDVREWKARDTVLSSGAYKQRITYIDQDEPIR